MKFLLTIVLILLLTAGLSLLGMDYLLSEATARTTRTTTQSIREARALMQSCIGVASIKPITFRRGEPVEWVVSCRRKK